MTKRRHRTDEEWFAILREYETSELNQAEFAKKHGLSSDSRIYKSRQRFGLKYERGDPRNLAKLGGGSATALVVSPRAKRGAHYPDEVKHKALELRATGMTYAAISQELGIGNPALVYSWANNAKRKPASSAVSTRADVTTAINLLRRMDKEVTRMIRQHKIERADYAHQLGLMALKMLTGDE